jgi:AcrR family transcriptional regulator
VTDVDTPPALSCVPPRSGRHDAICAAVFELLSEVGYDRMSMDAVAARARSSKATIYRAWPTKPDMVIDAVVHRFGDTPHTPDTGSLRGDLLAVMNAMCQFASSADGAVLAGLMSASAHNPELSKTLHRCVYEMKNPMHESIIARAKERGEVPDEVGAGLLHEVMHSLVLARKLWDCEPLDDEYVVHVVDDVLIPVLCHRRGDPSTT